MKNDDLIRRLCEASEGSAELSREVWEALTGKPHADDPAFGLCEVTADNALVTPFLACLTTDPQSAWDEAATRTHLIETRSELDPLTHLVEFIERGGRVLASVTGKDIACTLCAAILAAEGER